MVNNQRTIAVSTVIISPSVETLFDNPAFTNVYHHALYHSKEERDFLVVLIVLCMCKKR